MQDQIFTFETLLRRMQLDDGERPFVIWREKDLFGTHAYPVKIDVPCLFLCWNGEMEIEINLQTYHSIRNIYYASLFHVPVAL